MENPLGIHSTGEEILNFDLVGLPLLLIPALAGFFEIFWLDHRVRWMGHGLAVALWWITWSFCDPQLTLASWTIHPESFWFLTTLGLVWSLTIPVLEGIRFCGLSHPMTSVAGNWAFAIAMVALGIQQPLWLTVSVLALAIVFDWNLGTRTPTHDFFSWGIQVVVLILLGRVFEEDEVGAFILALAWWRLMNLPPFHGFWKRFQSQPVAGVVVVAMGVTPIVGCHELIEMGTPAQWMSLFGLLSSFWMGREILSKGLFRAWWAWHPLLISVWITLWGILEIPTSVLLQAHLGTMLALTWWVGIMAVMKLEVRPGASVPSAARSSLMIPLVLLVPGPWTALGFAALAPLSFFWNSWQDDRLVQIPGISLVIEGGVAFVALVATALLMWLTLVLVSLYRGYKELIQPGNPYLRFFFNPALAVAQFLIGMTLLMVTWGDLGFVDMARDWAVRWLES